MLTQLLGLDYNGSTLDMGVGVIDAGYREPVDVILFNYSDQDNDETSSSS
jgi:dUTPase